MLNLCFELELSFLVCIRGWWVQRYLTHEAKKLVLNSFLPPRPVMLRRTLLALHGSSSFLPDMELALASMLIAKASIITIVLCHTSNLSESSKFLQWPFRLSLHRPYLREELSLWCMCSLPRFLREKSWKWVGTSKFSTRCTLILQCHYTDLAVSTSSCSGVVRIFAEHVWCPLYIWIYWH